MKRFFSLLAALAIGSLLFAQEFDGQSCTSIMVGRKASTDGSVMTSHTCDGRYRTWAQVEPAADHEPGTMHPVLRGTMHTNFRGDTTGVKLMGEIPEAAHTYAYLNTAYPCLNEKQLAIGETTFGGPDTLVNAAGWFRIEELERVALQRCDNARDAIRLMGALAEQYGYGDSGECLTVADKNEVWQFEIVGIGKERIGAAWVAKRVPDDHVAVSANIPRIGRIDRKSKDMMASANVEQVAIDNGLWDGKGEFIFWKYFNTDYAKGKNFNDREYFILNHFAPSLTPFFRQAREAGRYPRGDGPLPRDLRGNGLRHDQGRQNRPGRQQAAPGRHGREPHREPVADHHDAEHPEHHRPRHGRIPADRGRRLVRLFARDPAPLLAARCGGRRVLAVAGQPRPEPPHPRLLRHHRAPEGL